MPTMTRSSSKNGCNVELLYSEFSVFTAFVTVDTIQFQNVFIMSISPCNFVNYHNSKSRNEQCGNRGGKPKEV